MPRYLYKRYFKIPYGEVQWGIQSHSITVWYKDRCWHLWRGKLKQESFKSLYPFN